MTERQDMTRLTTVRGAGRAAREHAGRTAPGWAAVILRVAGSGLLIATAAIHLDLYLTGYRTIPTIGWLFLLQVIAAFGLGLAVLVIPSRLVIASRPFQDGENLLGRRHVVVGSRLRVGRGSHPVALHAELLKELKTLTRRDKTTAHAISS